MNSMLIPPAAWTERYESLRRYVLEGQQRLQTQPLGLALWLAKGMAGWMRQWTELLPVTAPPPASECLPGLVPGAWQEPLTHLLARMTLEQLQPQSSL